MEEWDEYEYEWCSHCDGSGEDEVEWNGLCIYCHGSGELLVRQSDDEYDDDDEP